MTGRSTHRTRAAAFGIALAIALVGCTDNGPPSTEEQLRHAGLPLDTLVTVDEHTQVMVRLNDGTPEAMIFTPDRFGGSDMNAFPADQPSVNHGRTGQANSSGPYLEADRAYGPGWKYLFGAGQGPIEQVVVDSADARAAIVNPDIGGWVIVMSETADVESLRWKLLGADGSVVYQATGAGLPADEVLPVDDRTSVTVDAGGGKVRLLVFTTNESGTVDRRAWAASTPTVAGGAFGVGESVGVDGSSITGYHYFFGAGQGPLQGVMVDQPEARTSIVNADVGGWVIVAPGTTPFANIAWRLLGTDGGVVFAGQGFAAASP